MTTHHSTILPTAPPQRVATYTRVAYHSALAVASLEVQRTLCDEAVVGQGWKTVKRYVDAGWSSHSLQRPALACLLADVNSRCFDIVLVSHVDRMSRNLAVLQVITEDLRRAGAALFARTNLGTVIDVGAHLERLTTGGLGGARGMRGEGHIVAHEGA